MDPIGGKPDEHAQVTGRPDNMSDALLHEDCYGMPMDAAVRPT